jgi:DNA-binding MarR family transcriptional regulator
MTSPGSGDTPPGETALGDDDFARLLAFRDGLRRFLHWSEDRAKEVGLTAGQHQLLLAVRGHGTAPSIGEVAEHLLLRHHSAVELIDRAVRAGLLERFADEADHRIVRLRLTATGDAKLTALTTAHLEELSRLQSRFSALWSHLPTP